MLPPAEPSRGRGAGAATAAAFRVHGKGGDAERSGSQSRCASLPRIGHVAATAARREDKFSPRPLLRFNEPVPLPLLTPEPLSPAGLDVGIDPRCPSRMPTSSSASSVGLRANGAPGGPRVNLPPLRLDDLAERTREIEMKRAYRQLETKAKQIGVMPCAVNVSAPQDMREALQAQLHLLTSALGTRGPGRRAPAVSSSSLVQLPAATEERMRPQLSSSRTSSSACLL